jgi:hypothetical protein
LFFDRIFFPFLSCFLQSIVDLEDSPKRRALLKTCHERFLCLLLPLLYFPSVVSFVEAASKYARIIIDELPLPVSKKTIKPVGLGGVAGGEKFIHEGILFKLTADPEVGKDFWLYGGSSPNLELAAKACSQELKSCNYFFRHFYETGTKISVPIQVCFFLCLAHLLPLCYRSFGTVFSGCGGLLRYPLLSNDSPASEQEEWLEAGVWFG